MRAFGTFDTGPPAAGPGDRPRSSSLSRPPRFPSAAGQGLKAPDHRVPQRFLSPGVGLHWHWPRPSTSSLESLDYDLQERSWTRYCSVRRLWRSYTGYFFHHPVRDGVLYGGLVLMLLCYSAICLTAPNGPIPLISIPHCDQTFPKGHGAFSNPSTQRTPCTGLPHPQLGYLNLEQCDNGVRLLAAVLCAFFLCNERAKHDHPVIFRLVPLVSVCPRSCPTPRRVGRWLEEACTSQKWHFVGSCARIDEGFFFYWQTATA